MKIIDLGLDYDEIRRRIEIDKSQYKGIKWSELTGVSINTLSNIHGKAGKNNPSLQYIIAVARVTGKPIEWYLYGKLPESQALFRVAEPVAGLNGVGSSGADPCPVNCDEKLRELCAKVKKVLDSPWSYSGSLEQNIHSFHEAVEEKTAHKMEIEKLKDNVTNVINELKHFRETRSSGQDGDTTEKPVTCIARKNKTG